MTTRGAAAAVILVLAMSIVAAAQSAQELYQRGLVQEHANGDLTQAIALYAQAAKAAGRDRALAAKALIRVAGSHEKLGADADAQKAYSELLRTYPEQRAEVAIAKERLAALRRSSVSTTGRMPSVDRATDGELAARLAMFLWNGPPDAALLEAVSRGDLDDPAALTRHVSGMLRDPRAAGLVDNFFAKWLSLDRLKTAQPDPVLYPQFDEALRAAMATETQLFLESQLHEDRDAVELWTAPYTYLNGRLARHYGVSDVSGDVFRRVNHRNPDRAGLLGHAGVLTALSMPTRTSPTVRGSYVLTRFLGIDAPPPPANVPPLVERSGGTMHDRLLAHRTHPACASCHVMFDPLGFALENFDATGGWRTVDGGSPIDASGTFMDGTRFNGPIEFRRGLLKHRDAYYANVSRRLLAYALNRQGRGGRVYDYEMPAVRKIVRDASASGYRWSSILAGIASSEPFRMRELVP